MESLIMQTILSHIIVATAVFGLMDGSAGSLNGSLSAFDVLESIGEGHINTVGDLDDYTNRLHNLARLQTARAFSIETRRHRRDLDMTSLRVTGTREFTVPMAEESRFNASAFENVMDVHVLNTEDGEFWILSYNSTQLLVEATPSGLQLIDEFDLVEGVTRIDYVSGHVVNGQLCVAIASSLNGWVQTLLIGNSKTTVATIQTIAMDGLVGGLHMFGTIGHVYLVVGARPLPDSLVADRKSRIYILRNKHFARLHYLDFRPSNVTDVIGFSHRGFYYLVFSMFHSAGSEVYKFDVIKDAMTFHQQIPESDGLQLQHFYEMQEGQHYVVLYTAAFAKIYRWASEQLLLWQVLDSSSQVKPISSIDIFIVSTLETIILVASGGRVMFYADDIFASFQPSFLMVTDCDNLSKVSLVQMNGDYVILYMCRTLSGKLILDSRQVLMEEVTLEKPVHPITECILELEYDLEARKPKILFLEETFADNLVMTTEGSQTWSAPIIFEEGLRVEGKTTFQHPLSIKGHVQPLQHSFDDFFSKTALLEGQVRSVESGLPNLLYHSGNQVFCGTITAVNVSADTFESNATKIAKLNGRLLQTLAEVFLIDGFDQNMISSMFFNTMACEKFVTRGNSSSASINGIATNELMRRNEASQKITGKHTYRNLTVESITGLGGKGSALMINDIFTNDVVTMGTSASFLDKKTIKNMMVVKRTNIRFLNSVDLSTLQDDLVYKNMYSTQILAGNYSFDTVKVTGNVDVTLINDVNFKLLETRTVKKTQNFKLSGKVNYQNMSVTTLDSPKLNGISWSSIVSDDTTTISGNYHFVNATVTASVVSDSVNGLDISKDVVTTNTAQTLQGKLCFTDDLVINASQGLHMSQGSTINNIDPLSLLSMDRLGNLMIQSNIIFTSTLQVSDHVIANRINGLDMSSIENRYWRKDYPQEVNVSPSLESAAFGESLIGCNVNGHHITDFFMREGLQIVYGSYKFEEDVRVTGSISLKYKKTINGVDLSTLAKNTVNRNYKEDINAETSLVGKLTVSGDLTLNGKLNGWNVTSDFMQLDLISQHTGNLTFAKKTSVISLSIANADLVVQSLNGLDVKASVDDLVLATEDTTINGTLMVTGTAKVIKLNVSGTVDGVDLEDLAVRSLKKSAISTQLATDMLTVDEVVFSQSPALEWVNSKNWNAHLTSVVGLDYNSTVKGKKTFKQPLSVEGDFNLNLINRVINVSALGLEILTKNTAQNITQRYTFSTNITAKNVNANVIDCVNTSNLLLVDQDSFIPGTLAFTENVIMTNLLSRSGILDGCNITQVNKSAIWKSENGSLDIDFWFSVNDLVVVQEVTAVTVEAGTHKRDLIDFLDNVVSISKTQDIYGIVEFKTNIQIKNLTAKVVDGVDMDTFYNVTVLNKEKIVINCDMEFLKTLSIGILTVDSSIIGRNGGNVLINDVNVYDINNKAVLSTGGIYVITGTKTFPNGFNTTELFVGSIRNLPVGDLVVLNNTSKLASYITFEVPITVKGNVQIDGLLDGVNLRELLANRIKLDTADALNSSITFSDVKVEGDLIVDAINDIRFAEIVVRSRRNRQEIVGYKTLEEGMYVNGEIEANLINGINVTHLNETAVMKTKSAVIKKKVIFTKNVIVNNAVDVTGNVNNHDLSELKIEYLEFKENIEDKSKILNKLNATLSMLQTESLFSSCGVYETLSYAEVIRVTDVGVYGKMTTGVWEGHSQVIVRQCDGKGGCSCPMQYAWLTVDANYKVEATSRSSGSAFFFDINGYSTAGLINTCMEEGNGNSLIKLRKGRSTEFTTDALGIVSDVATFVAKNNGVNVTYITTVGAIEEWDTDGIASINVLRIDELQVRLVWSMSTAYSAASVDLTLCESGWIMLVANEKAANVSVDPYTVPSQIYLWSETEEKFTLQGEFLGQHVTSGMFLRSKTRLEEQFFTLTQLKSVDPPVLEETRRYTAEVLVFRHDGSKYIPHQKLRSFGVVGQTHVYVGDDLFLCLLSSISKTVDIYEHRVSEGFRLFQKLRVCDQPVDIMKMSKELLIVSCMDREMMTVQLHRKGYSYNINKT